jgi:hypothetical protein
MAGPVKGQGMDCQADRKPTAMQSETNMGGRQQLCMCATLPQHQNLSALHMHAADGMQRRLPATMIDTASQPPATSTDGNAAEPIQKHQLVQGQRQGQHGSSGSLSDTCMSTCAASLQLTAHPCLDSTNPTTPALPGRDSNVAHPACGIRSRTSATDTYTSFVLLVRLDCQACLFYFVTWCMASARRPMFLVLTPAMLMRPFLQTQ